ncbi:uncharacterized protein JN550_001457 [Neoarthrinium moseri]|uniref:uncharacterized protein n=1 Tax=Neoarthrinium moseri TaxID=1658444 RepID=UPI001FDE2AA6|nr:uncharacterized protein JN550_001457 [Neoarthrinium moseri]KAI1875961.1 hypothetical protein JN550_001457 [Neoarthrinium moseri]
MSRSSAIEQPGSRAAQSKSCEEGMHFRLLDLPTEVRQLIFRLIVPHSSRILLDFRNIYRPLPYCPRIDHVSRSLVLVNKAICHEVTELIFSLNIVNIIQTTRMVRQPSGLGKMKLAYIRTLELHTQQRKISGFAEVLVLVNHCPHLIHARLVLYHTPFWPSFYAKVARYVAFYNDKVQLDLELFTSVVGRVTDRQGHPQRLGTYLSERICDNSRDAIVGVLQLHQSLAHITVTASVIASAAGDLLGWRAPEPIPWEFKKLSYQRGAPQMTRLGWVKRAASDRDTTRGEVTKK